MQNYSKVAEAWRKEHPDFSGYGFVLIFAGEVSGWKAEITRPGTVCPGTHAYGVDGSEFLAEGGDETSGAMRWTPIQCPDPELGVASQSV